jgi:ribonuclease R
MSKKSKKRSNSPASGRETFTGRLEVTRSGMGFVVVPDQEQDILIKRENLLNALNGDEVKVEVRSGRDSSRRPEGQCGTDRGRTQAERNSAGRVEVHPHFAFFIPDGEKSARGHIHTAAPAQWRPPWRPSHGAHSGVERARPRIPVGEIVSVLTDESQNEIAMQGLLVENGFPAHLP